MTSSFLIDGTDCAPKNGNTSKVAKNKISTYYNNNKSQSHHPTTIRTNILKQ